MYDTKCYNLAVAFLEDEPAINTPERVNQLAQKIQDTIEDEINMWTEDKKLDDAVASLGDCVSCDGYVLTESDTPHCPTCARLIREGKAL